MVTYVTPLKSTFFLSIFVRLPVALILNKDVKTIFDLYIVPCWLEKQCSCAVITVIA